MNECVVLCRIPVIRSSSGLKGHRLITLFAQPLNLTIFEGPQDTQ